MNKQAFQDCYPDELSHCFGCGKNNPLGHQLKSYWQYSSGEAKGEAGAEIDNSNETTIAHFTPQAKHTAIPGFVYGGLLASLIDCHGTGSAAAMAYQQAGRAMGTLPALRFVTAALNVSYLAPTPLGVELTLIGKFKEVKPKKIIVEIDLIANDKICVKGEVIAVLMPETMLPNIP